MKTKPLSPGRHLCFVRRRVSLRTKISARFRSPQWEVRLGPGLTAFQPLHTTSFQLLRLRFHSIPFRRPETVRPSKAAVPKGIQMSNGSKTPVDTRALDSAACWTVNIARSQRSNLTKHSVCSIISKISITPLLRSLRKLSLLTLIPVGRITTDRIETG